MTKINISINMKTLLIVGIILIGLLLAGNALAWYNYNTGTSVQSWADNYRYLAGIDLNGSLSQDWIDGYNGGDVSLCFNSTVGAYAC